MSWVGAGKKVYVLFCPLFLAFREIILLNLFFSETVTVTKLFVASREEHCQSLHCIH